MPSRIRLLLAVLFAGCLFPASASAARLTHVMVGFDRGVSAGAARLTLVRAGALEIRYLGGARRIYSVQAPAYQSIAWAPRVRFVERDHTAHLLGTPTNESQFASFWWLLGQQGSAAAGGIDAIDAWDQTQGAGVTVAVLDSGIDLSHSDLAGNLWVNPAEIAGNGADDEQDGIVDDVNGANFVEGNGNPSGALWHGTHAAGIIAAVGNNEQGVVGVAYQAKIMPVRVMDDNGDVAYDTAVKGIYYAVKHGAKVINISWGGYQGSTALYQALVDATRAGVIVVCAAGNDGRNNDNGGVYPASYQLPGLISVAASTADDQLAGFSNYGKGTVDVAAPGDNIISTYPGGKYAYASGTSMAAPMVSGIAALLVAKYPTATPGQIKAAIMTGADPAPAFQDKVYTGGRADALGALNAFAQPQLTPPSHFVLRSPAASFTLRKAGQLTLRWNAASDPTLAGYQLLLDGRIVTTLGPERTSYVAQLRRGHHVWSVIAFDRATNERRAGR